jgi:predicted AlkP superfamily pyrophosphatase or phosphodiesterase
MACWRKQDIPVRYHYGRNPRVPPLLCLPQTGWQITTHSFKGTDVGNHGFDPYSPEMAALFVANGPAFRKGVVLRPFDNVDVYPLLARLIGVTPLAGDGAIGPLRPSLRQP